MTTLYTEYHIDPVSGCIQLLYKQFKGSCWQTEVFNLNDLLFFYKAVQK